METIHFGDLSVDGRIILKCMIGYESVDWVHLVQDRDSGELSGRREVLKSLQLSKEGLGPMQLLFTICFCFGVPFMHTCEHYA
jgi:hypothetical protein